MNQEELEIKLYSSLDEYEMKQISAILQENDIPYIRKDAGSGSYMNIYMGQSIQEKMIYVSKNDYDRAVEIVDSFINTNIEDSIELDEENEQIEEDDGSKYKLIGRILGISVLVVPVLITIIGIILPLIYYIKNFQ